MINMFQKKGPLQHKLSMYTHFYTFYILVGIINSSQIHS